MSNPSASSGGGQSTRKTILDLPSNSRLAGDERYVGRIISQKIVKLVVIQNVLTLSSARYDKFKISEIEDRIMLFEFDNI